MLSSEISLCLAEAFCFMLVKCVGRGVQGFGDVEVVAKGVRSSLFQATTGLFPNFPCIRHLLFN